MIFVLIFLLTTLNSGETTDCPASGKVTPDNLLHYSLYKTDCKYLIKLPFKLKNYTRIIFIYINNPYKDVYNLSFYIFQLFYIGNPIITTTIETI
uniref:CUB domain-containing protein n=1 Tax=Octopus bimaculoides TaxID=37653 RepID=A0A0L8FVB3_OCTBM